MENFVTIQEAAQMVGKSIRTIQRHIATHGDKSTTHRRNGKTFVSIEFLRQWYDMPATDGDKSTTQSDTETTANANRWRRRVARLKAKNVQLAQVNAQMLELLRLGAERERQLLNTVQMQAANIATVTGQVKQLPPPKPQPAGNANAVFYVVGFVVIFIVIFLLIFATEFY